MSRFTRRTFAKLFGAAAGAVGVPEIALGQMQNAGGKGMHGNEPRFPEGFLWGSATASYQVEGAVHEGGRGPTIWDSFSHTPGKTANGDTGDVADDFYHRYRQDIALMKEIGLKGFRFSIAWSRILPTGTGQVNQAGLDFYKKLVDALLEAGVTPFCTLYHWDLPQPLEDRGGWANPDTARAMGDYAGVVAEHLSDRIHNFMTTNEISTFIDLGYRDGTHAPGRKLSMKGYAQAAHYAVLGQGLCVQAIRAKGRPGTRVGLAENAVATVPVIENEQQIAAAEIGFREENAKYLNVILTGRYTDWYLKKLGADAPHFTPEEMKIIASPHDFIGLNCYQPTWVRAANNEIGYEVVPYPASYPTMYSPWLKVGPEGLYWLPTLVHRLYGVDAIYITENGCSSKDVVAADGHVWDTDRTMFLRNYLTQLQRAVADGAPVKGYFLWSLLDNYEWADGYDKRFGITYVDFATQKRIPKLSAHFYKDVIARNALA